MQNYYNDFFEKGQQKLRLNFYDIRLSADDPVYTLKKVMEELDFTALTEQYSNKGRKGYNPIMKYAVLQYANMRGIREVDKIVELCKRDIAFIWLTKGEVPKRDAFYDFINNKLNADVLENLHYQFMRKLEKEELITLKELFIDGTKIEANANRYTFVWRGSVNYHLAGLLDKIDEIYKSYNELIITHNYEKKYHIKRATMFIIDGIDKVKEVIEKNRKRKLTKYKKLSNNSIIEIGNISPLELLKLQTNLKLIAENENIEFNYGKGQKRLKLQKLYEDIEEASKRLLKYKDHFVKMGEDRNSYSKTDIEATFMRMKDDHMRNGQLKAAYNVQIAVENYFIVHSHISNDRTDYNTLIPVLEKHNKFFSHHVCEVTADSGYSSEKNLLFLKENEIKSYIKLQAHEKMKTRAYKNDIGKYYNMKKVSDKETTYFICKNNKKLEFQNVEYRNKQGYIQKYNVYACSNCNGCTYKDKCLYKYDQEKHEKKNKVMKINERWEELKAESHKNIQSEKGILNRQIRSIQTEGHFGDIKENGDFRRFNHRSKDKVYKEFLLYAFGRNLNKYDRFLKEKIVKYEMKTA